MTGRQNIDALAHPTLILSHGTARSYYRAANPALPGLAKPCNESPLPEAKASRAAFSGLNLAYPGFGRKPLEALVASREAAWQTADTKAHVCSSQLPADSFWKIGNWLYISSPELCFMQMAKQLSEPNLIKLGMELCAKHYIDPISDKPLDRNPLTTTEKIAAFLDKAQGASGAAKAKRALRWVLDRSDSPKETDTALLLTYEKRYGGAGLRGATFDYHVNPGRFASLAEQGHFEIDLAFPDYFVGVEYYGEKEHSDPIHDRRRLDALAALGWHMVVVDKQRLYSLKAFEVVIRQIARHMKLRVRLDDEWRANAMALRHDLSLA